MRTFYVFREEVYCHISKPRRKKFDAKGKKEISYFMRYEENIKDFRIWFPEEDAVRVERNIIFTGRSDLVKRDSNNKKEVLLYLLKNDANEGDISHDKEEKDEDRHKDDNLQNEDEEENFEDAEEDDESQEEDDVNQSDFISYRRNLRDKSKLKRPSRYKDFVDPEIILIAEGYEPINYKNAVNSDEANSWRKAMNEEIISLVNNKV